MRLNSFNKGLNHAVQDSRWQGAATLCPHLEQLFGCEAEFGQRLGDFPRMLGQAGGHCRHHGRAFPTATLRQQESHVRVGHKAAHGLVESPGISGGGAGEGFSQSAVEKMY